MSVRTDMKNASVSGDGRIFVNGKIFTSDPENPCCDSMVVENGRVSWIGTEAEMPAGYRDRFEKTDLNGKRVIPGFIDAHMHPMMLSGFSKQISCLPPKVNSISELIDEIRRVREKQGSEKWILGWGYDEGKFAEKRSPNRYDLDKGCSDAPVCLLRTCAHIRCVNSKALEIAGITKYTPDPEGGEIERDESGEPTGVLKETARDLVTKLIPESTEEEKISQLVDLGELLLSQGITAVGEMGNLEACDDFYHYEEAVKRGFKQRVAMYYMWDHFKGDPDFDIPAERFDKDRQIRVAGIKVIGDGSISGRTAWVYEPYLGDDQEYGISVCTDEDLDSAVAFCKAHKCQISMHAMGGRTIHRIVDKAYREDDWIKDGVTPYARVEHVTEPLVEDMEKAVEKGMAFVTQPIFLYAEVESYVKNMGPDRMHKTYPVPEMLAKGVQLAFSTDAPATSWAVPSDPFPCLKGAVTRKAYDGTDCGQENCVDIETALRLYTAEAAHACGFKDMGMLKAGYHGDFTVLDKDILCIDPEDIDKIKVEQTYIDGEKVYDVDAK